MLDFQITLSEKHIHEFLSICRRMLAIAEYNLPTPSEEMVTKAMRPREIIPGKVGRLDQTWHANAAEAADRYEDRTGEHPSVEQVQREVEEMKKEGLL